MKIKLLIAGVIGMLLLAFYIDSRQEEMHHPSSRLLDRGDRAEEVSGMSDEKEKSYAADYEYIYEETREDNGYIVQVYQEYEIELDENGQEVNREPTGNYEFLRYKK